MKELNTDFYDEYKRLDKFCRDMFSGQDGAEYIKQMENNALYRYYVPTWDEDLRQLKRMRHLRNQLAHEVEFDADLCTEMIYYSLRLSIQGYLIVLTLFR